MGILQKIKDKYDNTKQTIKNAKAYMNLCKTCRTKIETKIFKEEITDIDKIIKLLCPHCKTKYCDV